MRGLEAVRYSGAGLFFFGAVLLALLAGLAVYSYLASAAPSATVVALSRDVAPGATITASDLQVKQMPTGAVPEGAVVLEKDAVGRRVRYGLVAGDVLRQAHLVPDGGGDVARKVADMGAEFRAVSLPGELVPAPGRLIPGDQLELMGVVPVQDQRTNSQVAVPLGVATVLDVRLAAGQTDRTTVLVAMKSSDVPKLALTLKAGTLMVAVQGTGQAAKEPAPMRLEVLTGSGTTTATVSTAAAAGTK